MQSTWSRSCQYYYQHMMLLDYMEPMDYHLQHVLNYSIHMYFHTFSMDWKHSFQLIRKFSPQLCEKNSMSTISVSQRNYLLIARSETYYRRNPHQQLKLLCSIIRNENVTTKSILLRQIRAKSDDSNSWFTHIINLLEHYDLPTIKTVLHIVWCEISWKREVKLWNQKLISDCSQKSSLAFYETAFLSIGNVHRIWTAVQTK